MNARALLPLALPLFLTLVGCAGVRAPAPAEDDAAMPVAPDGGGTLPFAEPGPVRAELDETLLFDYLVGEIGARLGDLSTAADAYLEAARQSGDPYAAQRAARIAWHLGRAAQAETAAALWVRLAPNDIAARRLLGLVRLARGDAEGAHAAFSALLRIARARGIDGHRQIAGALARAADAEAALTLMRRLVSEAGPEREAEARHALALLLAAKGRPEAAAGVLRELVEARPERASSWLLLARTLESLDRRDEALAVYGQALKRHPGSRELALGRARLLVALERYEAALDAFRALHRQDPESDEVVLGHAMLATQQGRWEEARPLWERLRRNPAHADEATYFLGVVEAASGRAERALDLFRRVRSERLRIDATIRAADLLAGDGRVDEARRLLRAERARQPDRAVDLYRAEVELLQREGVPHETIEALFAEALAAAPDDIDLLYARGLFRANRGDLEGMEADFRRVLALDPENADALNALGYTWADHGVRLAEARELIERALALEPDSAPILDSMGWVLYRQGDAAAALPYLRRALADGPDPEIASHLVEVLRALGRHAQARAVLDEALEAHPDDARLRALRSEAPAR